MKGDTDEFYIIKGFNEGVKDWFMWSNIRLDFAYYSILLQNV